MSRKKVKLAYIANDTERKASYKKRKKGLIKKVSELSTLCGVEACAIIYSQYDPEPVVWPSREGVLSAFSRFNRLSEMDQTRKMINQEEFTRQRIRKTRDQLTRFQKENKRTEMENFMYECMSGLASLKQFNLKDSSDMTFVIVQIRRDIKSRMELLQKNNQQIPSFAPTNVSTFTSSVEVPRATLTLTSGPPPPPSPPPEEIFGSFSAINELQNFGVEWDYNGELLQNPTSYGGPDFGGN